MRIYKICPMCGKEHVMEASERAYIDRDNGMMIQDAFPDYNPMEREFIKSGYCPKCQKLLFCSDYDSIRIKIV